MPLPPLASPVDELSDMEIRYHAHQMIHPELSTIGQRRLKNGRVLVIGADEVEAPALTFLADSGVGHIGLVDDSPLQPWDPHPNGDTAPVGSSRASAWKAGLTATHQSLTIVTHETTVDAGNALSILDAYDVVACASEDPALCYLIDDACARLGKPFVWGGVGRSQGQVSVFWARHGPTYRDLHPTPPVPYFRGMAGVLTVLGAWVSLTMAVETVKLLTGRGEPLVGRVMEYDALEAHCAVATLSPNPGTKRPAELTASEPYFGLLSPQAAEAARGSTVSVSELDELLRDQTPLCLVDVREPAEHALVKLPGSVLIPKGEFFSGDAVTRLPKDQKIVLYCRMGIRSAEVLAVVKAHGHTDAVHLGGGIVAWAEQIDPSMPTY